MDIDITIRLSERLEKQIERLLELLTTATLRQEEDNGNIDENLDND